MKVCALWYGGISYASPDPDQDLEQFKCINDARRAFEARADHHPRFPCVEGSEMHIYKGRTYHENGPDLIFKLGPKGGVVVEKG